MYLNMCHDRRLSKATSLIFSATNVGNTTLWMVTQRLTFGLQEATGLLDFLFTSKEQEDVSFRLGVVDPQSQKQLRSSLHRYRGVRFEKNMGESKGVGLFSLFPIRCFRSSPFLSHSQRL